MFDNGDEILKFKATITYCRYYSEDSTWGVFGFSTEDEIPQFTKETKIDVPFEDNQAVNPDKKFSTLAGKMQELVIGGEYMVKAKYKYDKTYGHQYTPIAIYVIVLKEHKNKST